MVLRINMKLKVLGSSSSGNCYILEDKKGNKIMLEAGLPFAEIKKRANYDLKNLNGVFVSHSHGDHAKGAHAMAVNGYKVYSVIEPFNNVKEGSTISIGDFSITPFEAVHDVECYNCIIHHEECGTILFATDTKNIPVFIERVNHFMIEANYSQSLLQELIDGSRISYAAAKALVQRHMSLETAVEEIIVSGTKYVRNIILLHMSDRNSNEDYYKRFVSERTGIMPKLADKGMEVNLW